MVEWHWVNASRQPEIELIGIAGSTIDFSPEIFDKLPIKMRSEDSFNLDK